MAHVIAANEIIMINLILKSQTTPNFWGIKADFILSNWKSESERQERVTVTCFGSQDTHSTVGKHPHCSLLTLEGLIKEKNTLNDCQKSVQSWFNKPLHHMYNDHKRIPREPIDTVFIRAQQEHITSSKSLRFLHKNAHKVPLRRCSMVWKTQGLSGKPTQKHIR